MDSQDQNNSNNSDKRPPQLPPAKSIMMTRRCPAQSAVFSTETDAEIDHLLDQANMNGSESENYLVSAVPKAPLRLQPFPVRNYDTDNQSHGNDQSTDDPLPSVIVNSDLEDDLIETNNNEIEASPINTIENLLDSVVDLEDDLMTYSSDDDFENSTSSSDDESERLWLILRHGLHMRRICQHNLSAVPELLRRAQGVAPRSAGWQRTNASNIMSHNRTYGTALKIAQKLLSYRLNVHTGAVNDLHFSSDDSRLCSGSDDGQIIVWKWAKKTIDTRFVIGRKYNVVQTKFMDYGGTGTTIVSSDCLGEVRLHRLRPDGGHTNLILSKPGKSMAKLAVNLTSVSQFLSAERKDANIYHYDLRSNDKNLLTTVTTRGGGKMMLCSISHHPLANQFCVGGFNPNVQVFDYRNAKTPLTHHCADGVSMHPCINCVTYNWDGSEILATYYNENVVLFDANCDELGKSLHKYLDHFWGLNTTAAANFMGKYSEFIADGSSSGLIRVWKKNTEELMLYQRGDIRAGVNVIEAHPRFPILATCGYDKGVKIWHPSKIDDNSVRY